MAAHTIDDMMLLQHEIDARVKFISQYEALAESHLVDFFTKGHWENLLHPSIQECLLQFTEEELHSISTVTENLQDHVGNEVHASDESYTITNLVKFLVNARACWIEQSKVCSDITQFCDVLNENDRHFSSPSGNIHEQVTSKEYMCMKKSHEVKEMASLVANICKKYGASNVLDMGSGKGYFGTYLSLKYKLDVVGIDCNESNSTNALSRSKKFMKYWNGLLQNKEKTKFCENDMNYTPITAYLSPQTDIQFPFVDSTGPVILTGLHSCGDLSSTALRTFLRNPKIRATVVVGCCYHLLSSEFDDEMEQGFPLSNYLLRKNFRMRRNTRMLGLKSMDRIESSDVQATEEKSTRSLFYRAALSIILEKEFQLDSSSKNLRVGKEYSKSKSFTDYVRRCLKKLKIPEQETISLTDDSIMSYLLALEGKKKTLVAFNMLREAFGPVVEALILLDRLLFLKEQQHDCNINSYLIRLFDPRISPRCYAIVGEKTS